MHLIKSLRPASFALVALLALSGPLVLGEDQAGTPAPARADVYVISVDFPGGPLSKLVALLRETKNAQLSIIQTAGLDPVLPAFSVNNSRVDAVIAALGQILEPQGYRLMPIGPNLAVLNKYERHTSQDFGSFQLEAKIGVLPGQATTEDVIAAIQQGCEFANTSGKPSTLRFKYHPATKLLFVAGTEQEVGIAHRVFVSLPDISPRGQPLPEKK